MKTNRAFWMVLFAAILLGLPAATAAKSCEDLSALSLPDTTITSAQSVAAGALTLPVSASPGNAGIADGKTNALPAFCRVAFTMRPTKDSDIKAELWIASVRLERKIYGHWQRRLGGHDSIRNNASSLLRADTPRASTDTGHDATTPGGSFALGHPEKLIDFGNRAVHETTLKAKAIIAAYYGGAPKLAYWNGCSSGGREGLKEAQRFPLTLTESSRARLPTTGHILGPSSFGSRKRCTKTKPATSRQNKYPLIHNAVLPACDAPRRSQRWRTGKIRRAVSSIRKSWNAKVADGPACLTTPQVEAARKIYARW